jgi:hypothetical protein
MTRYGIRSGLPGLVLLLTTLGVSAQNPFIRNQHTADPSARVFNGRVYVYPSHDILANRDRGRIGWFCMEDYHVFSSENLRDWTDHGVIVSQEEVAWVNPNSYSMWAPDCIERNGKFYFYFPSNPKDSTFGRGFGVGVAVADNPEGPFTSQPGPIQEVRGIDPNPLIDTDGQAYLYWSARNIFVARLKENMLELADEPVIIDNLPDEGLKEGPWVFERNGLYYLTYPHVENRTERLEYAMGKSPTGPFEVIGVIMDESASGCWTNHQSITEYEGQWYLFYHDMDLSPRFDKARSIRVDSLFFNADGTIRKVTPTLRGVGITPATDRIEIDRYSMRSDSTVRVEFLDTLNRFEGWKVQLDQESTWIRYNRVDFGSEPLQTVQVRVSALHGAILQLRLDQESGPVMSEVKVPEGEHLQVIESPISLTPDGIRHLVAVLKEGGPVEVDWIRFSNY